MDGPSRGIREGLPGGGSLILADWIDQYGEYIEADLQRFYRIDLADLFRDPRVHPSRLIRLIQNLPTDALTPAHAQGDPALVGFDRDRALWMDIFDAIQQNTFAVVMGNTDKKDKHKVTEPEPYPRPGKTKNKPGHKRNNQFAMMAAAQLRKAAAAKSGSG